MKKMIFLLMLTGFGISSPAQDGSSVNKRFSIHFGGVLPLGNFATDPFGGDPRAFDAADPAILETGKFSASTGSHVGFQSRIPLSRVDRWGLIASADLIYNGLKSGPWRDRIEYYGDGWNGNKKPRYLNVPLFVGLNYTYPLRSTCGLWVEGAAGPDFRKMTRYGYTADLYSFQRTFSVKSKLQVAFGYRMGAGILLNGKYSVGVHYYGLGRSKIEGKKLASVWRPNDSSTASETTSEPFTIAKRSSQQAILLRVGRHF